jgi:hypothetical protein
VKKPKRLTESVFGNFVDLSLQAFRARLDQIINMKQEMVQLAGRIDSEFHRTAL